MGLFALPSCQLAHLSVSVYLAWDRLNCSQTDTQRRLTVKMRNMTFASGAHFWVVETVCSWFCLYVCHTLFKHEWLLPQIDSLTVKRNQIKLIHTRGQALNGSQSILAFPVHVARTSGFASKHSKFMMSSTSQTTLTDDLAKTVLRYNATGIQIITHQCWVDEIWVPVVLRY